MADKQQTKLKIQAARDTTAPFQDKVDQWIAAAPGFAQPILEYLRALIHEAAPDTLEEIKWSRPFFVVNGTMVCYIAAFTKHCGLGFWSPEMTTLLKADGIDEPGSSGTVGRITSLDDLPPRADLLRYMRHAADMARLGTATTPMAGVKRASSKAPIALPPEFSRLLAQSAGAAAFFEKLSPSCRREYLEWMTSAKRPETRARRMVETVTRLAEGKRFNEEFRQK